MNNLSKILFFTLVAQSLCVVPDEGLKQLIGKVMYVIVDQDPRLFATKDIEMQITQCISTVDSILKSNDPIKDIADLTEQLRMLGEPKSEPVDLWDSEFVAKASELIYDLLDENKPALPVLVKKLITEIEKSDPKNLPTKCKSFNNHLRALGLRIPKFRKSEGEHGEIRFELYKKLCQRLFDSRDFKPEQAASIYFEEFYRANPQENTEDPMANTILPAVNALDPGHQFDEYLAELGLRLPEQADIKARYVRGEIDLDQAVAELLDLLTPPEDSGAAAAAAGPEERLMCRNVSQEAAASSSGASSSRNRNAAEKVAARRNAEKLEEMRRKTFIETIQGEFGYVPEGDGDSEELFRIFWAICGEFGLSSTMTLKQAADKYRQEVNELSSPPAAAAASSSGASSSRDVLTPDTEKLETFYALVASEYGEEVAEDCKKSKKFDNFSGIDLSAEEMFLLFEMRCRPQQEEDFAVVNGPDEDGWGIFEQN